MAPKHEIAAMRHAICLSALGLGTTSPNPPVGCVILDSDGMVAGTGYHQRKGEAHAEPQALAAAGARCRGGTAVVTLEPCNHNGLTPACRQALLDADIQRVVVAVIDPTSRGEGGAAALRAGGVDVEVEVLADEARKVLGPWLTSTLQRRPHVTWADAVPALGTHQVEACVGDLRRETDLLLRADGTIEEGVPGGHGVGMLQVPSAPWEPRDISGSLAALFQAGARTLLTVGDTPLARALREERLVDRVVVDLQGDPADLTHVPLGGFRVTNVGTAPTGTRITLVREF